MANKIIAAALVAVCVVLLCTAFAQQAAKIPNAIEETRMLPSVEGRYQPFLARNDLHVIDTQTGQCWIRSGGGWQDLGSPVKSKD